MQKILLFGAMTAMALTASAQRANDADASWMNDSHPSSYNLFEVSYDNTNLSGKNFEFVDDNSIGLNGFGVGYLHGFNLTKAYPMYLEAGLKWNWGYKNRQTKVDGTYLVSKTEMMRLNLPVSFAWRFETGNLSVTPFAGIDFRYNLQIRGKNEVGGNTDSKWFSYFDEDKMGEDQTWNRFQMGWHVGVRAAYSDFSLGISYGTDFIKAFSYNKHGSKAHVNTSNLAIALGYCF